MEVSLVWITPDAEKIMGYCARVSNPANQDNPDVAGLLRYCASKGHWSVFEMADMCLEIITSRTIGRQILRHRSFCFQEHSQRYAEVVDFEPVEARRQDTKNRQSSHDDLPYEVKRRFDTLITNLEHDAYEAYREMLEAGVAKECARFLLPETAQTRMYMKGSIRSWIHYLQARTYAGAQLEHQQVALAALNIFRENLPATAEALFGDRHATIT